MFIPVLLMGGVIGRVFNEFAVVVTVSILASMFVSLTLTPMLASRLLGQPKTYEEMRQGFGGLLERAFDRVIAGYDRGLRFCFRHHFLIFLVFIGTAAGSVMLFQSIPKGFFPEEDIGQLRVMTRARQDISFPAMLKLQDRAAKVIANSPYVAHVASAVGGSIGGAAMNNGRMFVELKPKDERPPLSVVLSTLRQQLAQVPGITTYMSPVQNLRIGARYSASQYQLVVQSLSNGLTNQWAQKLTDAVSGDGAYFTDVSSDLENDALEAKLVIDRDKAAIPRGHGRHPALDALCGLRKPAGLDDLFDQRQLSRHHGARSACRLDAGTSGGNRGANVERRPGHARFLRPCRAHRGPADRQSARAASGGHDLLQSAAGRLPRPEHAGA